MKKTLLILSLLIASVSYSQDTIQITVNQAKQAIINAQKVESLNHYIEAQDLQIIEMEGKINGLESIYLNQKEQISLLKQNNYFLTTELKNKNNFFDKVMLVLAGLGIGLLINSL